MAELQLLNGGVALVDDDCCERLAQYGWRRDNCGYAVLWNGSKIISMHRMITMAKKGQIVDHQNGDTLDNRTSNLRICSHAENMRNRRINKNNKSGFKGVWLDNQTKLYRAEIKAEGKRIGLGYHQSAEDAHAAYVEAAKKYHGEFANSGGAINLGRPSPSLQTQQI